ncbi:hypothetical protein EV421DRAFT_1812815 [Armillaria borealis]|uniref:Uncharacterized protein n=1 Tax=Armillaria borealis TaxID=47425 RepID=A0AA39JEM1_9AGAR|nr:hypothetical protein EV421DRAFT_1812815 [Armillaria borealis]
MLVRIASFLSCLIIPKFRRADCMSRIRQGSCRSMLLLSFSLRHLYVLLIRCQSSPPVPYPSASSHGRVALDSSSTVQTT